MSEENRFNLVVGIFAAELVRIRRFGTKAELAEHRAEMAEFLHRHSEEDEELYQEFQSRNAKVEISEGLAA